MKSKKIPFMMILLLTLAFGLGIWQFVEGVSSQIRDGSIQTITESTRQSANALNIQFEADYETLERMWQNIADTDTPEAVLAQYRSIEPDVRLYLCGQPDDGAGADQTVDDFLDAVTTDRGIIDSHTSAVTGENVFHIYVRGCLKDGTSAYLVKDYRTIEVSRHFKPSYYDDTGFSYLINRDGDIMVRPRHKNSNTAISNIFGATSQSGNDPDSMERFRNSIRAMESGWARIMCERGMFVFCYEPLREDTEWILVSAIPEYMITRQTASILEKALLFSGISVITILVVVAVFHAIKMHENEQHTTELTEALHAADTANHAKGRFLMDISHDFRTPLNAIIGMTAVARKNLSDQHKIEDCLSKISVSSTHLLSMVNDVLDMSQIDQGKIILKEEAVRLVPLYEETVNLIRAKALDHGQTLEMIPVFLKNGTVTGDPHRIRQILLNIIDNAIQYTPAGGHITLELTQLPDREDGLGVYCFRCADTGIGIEPEFLERLFLPFERARNTTNSKIAGTGLGLTITKSLLDLMDGSVSVESEPGKGTVFTITFYFHYEETQPDTQEAHTAALSEDGTPQETDYARKRVLIVEDTEINMEIMMELLDMAGVQVETACNGREAVQMVAEHPEGYYDLVFMDIQMPVMDGYEATRHIRRMDRSDAHTIPILAVSANTLASDVKNAIDAGMNDHIPKPVDYESVEKALRQYLG